MRRAVLLMALLVVGVPLGVPLGHAEEQGPELPADVEIPRSIVVGKGQPFLKIRANGALRDLRVDVRRRGWRRSFRLRSLAPGSEKTFRWRERPGVYRYTATVRATSGDWTGSQSFTWELSYLPPIEVRLSRQQIDLSRRQIHFQLNHPADRAELVVYGRGDVTLARAEESYDGAEPGTPLVIEWPEVSDEISRIELTVHDTSGYWTGVAITPWSLSIPHEEVEFETDRAEIRPSEEEKLDRAVELVHRAMREHPGEVQVNLYVAGCTDTVGSRAHNRELSVARARAIARYFAAHGVNIPIYYRGFGEELLAVQTGDETDEPRNRRALYILAPQPPNLQGAEEIRWGTWVRLPR